jgi:hypothetical protein
VNYPLRVLSQAFCILSFLVLAIASAQARPITIGSLDATRTSLPFNGGAFEQARASLLANFSSINDVAYPTIPNNPIPVDMLFLTNAGMTTPLSLLEQTALANYVNNGGTLLLSAFSDGSAVAAATAASLLLPFAATTTGAVTDGSTFYPTIPNLPGDLFQGVSGFTNSDASNLLIGGQGALAAALGDLDPVLLYYPTIPNLPVPRFGQALIYSNEQAFSDSENLGFFRENQQLFLNVASAATTEAVPAPATPALFCLGLFGLLHLMRRRRSSGKGTTGTNVMNHN